MQHEQTENENGSTKERCSRLRVSCDGLKWKDSTTQKCVAMCWKDEGRADRMREGARTGGETGEEVSVGVRNARSLYFLPRADS